MASKEKKHKKLGDFLSTLYRSSNTKTHKPKSEPVPVPQLLKKLENVEARDKSDDQKGIEEVKVVVEGRRSVSHIETNLSSVVSFLQVKVLVSDMPGFMQVHAFRCARRTYDSLEKFSSRHMAYNIKKEFDKVYGPAWHCIVGSNFGSFVTHSTGTLRSRTTSMVPRKLLISSSSLHRLLCHWTRPLVKSLSRISTYVSIDPYQLNRMKSYSSSQKNSDYAVAITPGEAIDAYGVGKVVVSENSEFEKGDIVVGLLNWGEFTVIKPGGMLNKLDSMGFPLSYHVGILGFSGLTAYAGLFEICKPKKGEKLFVSAALGSVGNLVGQFAKLFGCYVVGCAGSKEKVALLKDKLGFDDAFNYREETDLHSALKTYFPDGIDIYFDNVGGAMQEAAVTNMNINGRIAVCGVISEYSGSEKRAAPSMIDVIYKRIKIQGFLAGDYLNVFGDFLSTTCDHLRTGAMQPLEDISDGVESIPYALIDLFKGQNIGKKIVKIGDE